MKRLPAISLLACLAWSPAWAAPSADDAAREYNRVAKDAFKAEDYEKAVTNFERAFELLPDAKVRLNLALANDNLNRLDEAKGHYEAFLRENPKSDKAEQVRGKLGAVEKKMKAMGKLVIQVSPTPDRATLDGKPYQSVPIRVWLAPGRHTLHVEKAGHAPRDQDVEAKAGARAEVRVDLVASVEATPPPPAPQEEPRPAPPPAEKAPTPAPQEPAPAATPAPTPSTETATEPPPPARSNPLALVARVAGGVGLGAGVLALLVGVAGAAASGGIYGARITLPGTDKYTSVMVVGLVLGIAVLGVGLVLTPLLGGAGVVALVVSFFL